MNNVKHISLLYLTIAILTVTLFIQRCTGNDKVITVKTPVKKGVFVDSVPKLNEIVSDEVYKKQLRDTVLTYYHPVDLEDLDEFEKAKPDIKVAKYIEAKGERKYNNTFEDDNIKIEYNATTIGELKSLDLDYTIKPMSLEVPSPKSTVFALYTGGSLSTNTKLDEVNLNFNLGFQNKRGDLLYATYGTDHSVQVGYMFRIINIKK